MIGELDAGRIEEVLRRGTVARIGCHADGRTYVVPVSYAYAGGCMWCHSAEGMKLRMMRADPEVCVEVEEVDDLANWRSVIAWGRFEELTGAEAALGMELLVRRFMPDAAAAGQRPPAGGAPAGVTAFRIRLHERTGRYERRPEAARA